MEAAVVEEIKNFTNIWIIAFAAQIFCYYVVRQLPKGLLRLISLLPIFCLYIYFPMTIRSIHFITIITFFLTWLGSFKLILFAFDKGPIGDPNLPFKHFVPISCLPISICKSENPTKKGLPTPVNYITKTLILGLIIKSYEYRESIHPFVIFVLYICHLYLLIEVVLAITAYPARAMLGFEIEPHFQDPYLASSLQDLWGQRWNLMVPNILRPVVYLPIRGLFTPALGRKPALLIAMQTSFLVSGLMHELLYYYVSRLWPTWEVTMFFMVHGLATGTEVMVKKKLAGRWQLHRVVSGALTLTFWGATVIKLFLPLLMRYKLDIRLINEYDIVGNFIKDVVKTGLRLK